MRVIMLKSAATPYGTFQKGALVEVPDDVAENWISTQLAKRAESEAETAALEPPENAMLDRSGKSKKTTSGGK